ncbi:MAG TPA: RidA family protein [Nocardioides sp.]|nr:RidA family protein [Nocardioides sp.]
MTTIPEHAPVDDLGRLLHAEDYPAQLALALARLEATLARVGRSPRDVAELRVSTTDPRAFSAARDVLDERLVDVHAHPVTTVVEVAELPPPGTLVALGATLTTPTPKEELA